MNIEMRLAVEELFGRYVASIDNDDLEAWPDYFVEKCRYVITNRENHAAGLPHGVIYATSKGMLKDRVSSLREANIYEKHRYRHLGGAVQIVGTDNDVIDVRSSFLVVRIMHDGETMIFATGEYLDKVVSVDRQYLFKERLVVTDSQKYDTLLALPL